jgi:hypothetical protein
VDGVTVDAGEHVSEPSLWIDVTELICHGQRRRDSGTTGTAFGNGEQPRLASQGKSAKGAFGSIVRQADSPITKETREVILTPEHEVDWLEN